MYVMDILLAIEDAQRSPPPPLAKPSGGNFVERMVAQHKAMVISIVKADKMRSSVPEINLMVAKYCKTDTNTARKILKACGLERAVVKREGKTVRRWREPPLVLRRLKPTKKKREKNASTASN
jgi:hypothetical protein